MLDFNQRIVNDPAICSGKAVIKGTRVRLKVILDSLAEGSSIEEILEDYPSLTHEDVRAVIAYAAAVAADETATVLVR